MSVAATIIQRFGGVRPMARLTRRPSSTVMQWKRTGLIPSKHHQSVLADARRLGIPLEPAELVEPAADLLPAE